MWDNFDENEWDEGEDAEFHGKKYNSHPLMLKCVDIVKLTRAIVGSLDEARNQLYGSLMMESARLISNKFIETETEDNYIYKMENAVVMKIQARSLHEMTFQLAFESTHAEEHLQLLRDAIGDFKKLFVEWVKLFDKKKRLPDGWGLFED